MLTSWGDKKIGIPASVKEQLHGFPCGYTAASGAPERSRHRMIANSWHVFVVRFLFLLLLQTQFTATEAIKPEPKMNALQQVLLWAAHEDPKLGPGHWQLPPSTMPPTFDMWDHWEHSLTAVHPLFQPPQLEPGVQQTLSKLLSGFGDIPRLRHEVVHEVNMMIEAWTDFTDQWFSDIPPHVAAVYGHPLPHRFQVPVLLELLKQCGMTQLDNLAEDLTNGFAVVGHLHPGPGWLPRTDDRFQNPMDLQTFQTLNHQFVKARLKSIKPDPHWQAMLDELLKERKMGRLQGPFIGPPTWPVATVGTPTLPVTPLPDDDLCCAFSFSIEQTDKVRRIEDWTARFHNHTVCV